MMWYFYRNQAPGSSTEHDTFSYPVLAKETVSDSFLTRSERRDGSKGKPVQCH